MDDISNPAAGGSYTRDEAGNLVLLHRTKQALPKGMTHNEAGELVPVDAEPLAGEQQE